MERRGERGDARQRAVVRPADDARHAEALREDAREQRHARRRADRRGDAEAIQGDALTREALERRRVDARRAERWRRDPVRKTSDLAAPDRQSRRARAARGKTIAAADTAIMYSSSTAAPNGADACIVGKSLLTSPVSTFASKKVLSR